MILNGSLKEGEQLKELQDFAVEMLMKSGYAVDKVLLHERKIAPCLGCFGCWTRTPGICVINDAGRELTADIINSDVVVYLTPVTFGGYSSELKKAVDRIIPLMLPFFEKVQGETHHQKRYKSYPKVVVLGLMPEADDELKRIFCDTIKRNKLNWHGTFLGTAMAVDASRETIEAVLREAEVVSC